MMTCFLFKYFCEWYDDEYDLKYMCCCIIAYLQELLFSIFIHVILNIYDKCPPNLCPSFFWYLLVDGGVVSRVRDSATQTCMCAYMS